jgi:hypothetical protein
VKGRATVCKTGTAEYRLGRCSDINAGLAGNGGGTNVFGIANELWVVDFRRCFIFRSEGSWDPLFMRLALALRFWNHT